MTDRGADFYDLPSDEQITAQRALLLDALPSWPVGDVTDIRLLAERENAVFAVDTSTGRYAARVHRAGYHADAQLRSQVDWMRALTEAGVVETAAVVETTVGEPFVVASHPAVPEPRQVSLLDWVQGVQLSTVLESASTDEAGEIYERIGALAADLHHHARSWERPVDFDCFRWDVDGLLGEDAVWGRFWALTDLDPGAAALLADFRDHARSRLEALGRADERFGLVHNDFLAENLLVDGGRLTLLDFDDCGESWFGFDLAPAFVSVATRDDHQPLRDHFLAGYTARRPLDAETLDALPLFFALRMATYAAWLETRRHTQFARDLGAVIVEAAVDVIRRYGEGTLDV